MAESVSTYTAKGIVRYINNEVGHKYAEKDKCDIHATVEVYYK